MSVLNDKNLYCKMKIKKYNIHVYSNDYNNNEYSNNSRSLLDENYFIFLCVYVGRENEGFYRE